MSPVQCTRTGTPRGAPYNRIDMQSPAVVAVRTGSRAAVLAFFVLGSVGAQQPQSPGRAALTAADYARAERFMNYNTNPLVLHSAGRVTRSEVTNPVTDAVTRCRTRPDLRFSPDHAT